MLVHIMEYHLVIHIFLNKNLNWKGICIESNPNVYNRENCINLNIAIDNKDGECTFLIKSWIY